MLLRNKRIFMIEDNVTNLTLMAVILKQKGASVIQDPWAANTINRIKMLLPVDVIILDLMLRYGISGYDILDKLKADSELQDIPVVIVSAADPGTEMNKARAKGSTGYISKPINDTAFPGQIAKIIEGIEVWDDAEVIW